MKEIGARQRRMIDRLLGEIVDRLVDDESGAVATEVPENERLSTVRQ